MPRYVFYDKVTGAIQSDHYSTAEDLTQDRQAALLNNQFIVPSGYAIAVDSGYNAVDLGSLIYVTDGIKYINLGGL